MRQRHLRRSAASAVGVTALCATALLAAAPVSAAAGGNVVFRDHFTFDESHVEQEEHGDEFCDVPFLVLWEGRGVITDMLTMRRGDLFYASFKSTQTNRWTNLDTGEYFTERTSFSTKDQKVAVDEDGILTATWQDRLGWKLFGPDGRLIGVDAGMVRLTVTVDLHDLDDPEDDEELSFEVLGDHGVRQLGQRDFCTDVETFLG